MKPVNRAFRIFAGRRACAGNSDELCNRPVSPFVAGFLGPANVLPTLVGELAGESLRVELAGCSSFHAPVARPGLVAGGRGSPRTLPRLSSGVASI